MKQFNITNGERTMRVWENMLESWLNAGYQLVEPTDVVVETDDSEDKETE